MIKCSFCEQPLICKACGKAFQPRQNASHLGVYQPDTTVVCPECHKTLACKGCGFIYGEPDEKEE